MFFYGIGAKLNGRFVVILNFTAFVHWDFRFGRVWEAGGGREGGGCDWVRVSQAENHNPSSLRRVVAYRGVPSSRNKRQQGFIFKGYIIQRVEMKESIGNFESA